MPLHATVRPLLAALMALSLLTGAVGCGSGQGQGAAKSSQSSQGSSGTKKSAGGGHSASQGKAGSGGSQASSKNTTKGGGKGGSAGKSAKGGHSGQNGAYSSPQAAGAATTYHFYLTILTGGMTGKPGWPIFTPADFTLPPESNVQVSIRNFDSGAAPVTSQWSRVTGTAGDTVEIAGKSVRSIPPQQVSHTFTVPQLHLNVPIPASSTVTFAFRTPASGTYTWRCEAPCGSGQSGMQGAMRTKGYMMGTMRISATWDGPHVPGQKAHFLTNGPWRDVAARP